MSSYKFIKLNPISPMLNSSIKKHFPISLTLYISQETSSRSSTTPRNAFELYARQSNVQRGVHPAIQVTRPGILPSSPGGQTRKRQKQSKIQNHQAAAEPAVPLAVPAEGRRDGDGGCRCGGVPSATAGSGPPVLSG